VSAQQRTREGKPRRKTGRRSGPSPQKLAANRRRRRQKLAAVLPVLDERYGSPRWAGARLDPVSELVLTVLAQNTADTNSHRAFVALRERYATWDDVLEAPTDELVDVIRPGGLAPTKGRRIQHILAEIRDARGGWDLSFLADMPVAEARAWLTALPGIGRKTASIVLLFCFGMPVVPVDTHVHRVASRIGLIPAKTDVTRAHDLLEEAIEPADAYAVHVDLIRHGRDTCRAPRPICGICPVTEFCDYFALVRRGRAPVAPVPRGAAERRPRYHDELLHGAPPPE
jgi:endonuclease-3